MLMRHHHPESPDYYSSSLAAASAGVTSPSLSSLGIISSSLQKMPMEMRLRRSSDLLMASGRDEDDRVGALDEELSPKTECSEDSVEIRSTPMRIHRSSANPHHKSQVILRPSAVLASSTLKRPNNNNNNNCPNKMSNWTDSQQPDEKRMRLMGQQQPPPSPLTHFYHPASVQHQNVLKLAGQQHPHDFFLMEAERNRLFHHWMRPNNWPFPSVPANVHHPVVEPSAAHQLMTSALHYRYPHLLQQQQHQGNYNLPPHPFFHPSQASAASIFNLSYNHLLPHPMFHHQRPAFLSPASSAGVKTLPPISPVCARSVTPPPSRPSMLGPLPALVPVDECHSPRHPPDFNQKKVPAFSIPKASGESSPSMTSSLVTIKKKMKKSPVHPAGRSSSRQTKESTKCDSVCDFKLSPNLKNSGVKSSPVVPLFLSVETLLRRDKPVEKMQPEEELRPTELEEEEEEDEEDDDIHWGNSRLSGPSSSNSHRNYKNMTRERRMQANARERTRVHTISSAFEALRRAVPSFSHGQRLSKLSILRVASAYIAALGQLAGDGQEEEPTTQITTSEETRKTTKTTTTGRRQLVECVDRCTRTLMTEGQVLRRNRKRSGVTSGRQATDDEDD